MWRGVTSGSVVVAVATQLASSEARACQFMPGLHEAVPVGAEHPVNAAVILVGYLKDEIVTATIDGLPVAIVQDTALSMASPTYEGMYEILALRFEPAPVVGQTVAIDGVPCDDDDPEYCPPFHIEYVAVEPDDAIADGDGTVAFDLVRFATSSLNSCNEGGSVIETRPEVDPEPFADESFALFEVRAFHDGTGLEDVLRMPLSANSLETTHVFDETIVGPAFPLEGWCIELTVRDAAGNADVLGSSCDACMYADVDGYDWKPPVLPIPGGPCDDGSSTTTSTGGSEDTGDGEESTGDPPDPTADSPLDSGPASDDDPEPPDDDDGTNGGPAIDDGVADRGCACNSSAPPRALALLLPLALLGISRRSRRRGPADRPRRHARRRCR